MSDSYDVIVIGSGAGGGTLAHRLAPSGKRILVLERGDWLRREPQNWLSQDVFVDVLFRGGSLDGQVTNVGVIGSGKEVWLVDPAGKKSSGGK